MDFLPTTPGTQVTFTGKWCARHRWSTLNGVFRFIHRLGHRTHVLKDMVA